MVAHFQAEPHMMRLEHTTDAAVGGEVVGGVYVQRSVVVVVSPGAEAREGPECQPFPMKAAPRSSAHPSGNAGGRPSARTPHWGRGTPTISLPERRPAPPRQEVDSESG